MHALIIGLGSIGRRHLTNLRQLEPKAEITVWRPHAAPGKAGDPVLEADRVVHSLEEALERRPDMAIVAVPATLHVETGLVLARAGIHLLIEKPIAAALDGVDHLIETCRSLRVALMVGYNLRFYEPLKRMREALLEGRIGRLLSIRAEVGQYLPEWRPGRDYRETVSARRKLGGGAVLELSHELDYVRWMAGEVSSVTAEMGHVSNLDLDVEDMAEVLLRFHNGAFGSVHMDMVRRPSARTCEAIGSEGTLGWDGSSHRLRLYSAGSRTWEDLHPAVELERNTTFIEELRYFLTCVREGATPAVSGEEGRRVLEIALAAKQAAAERRHVDL